jgi:hypothetical protein
MALRKCGRTERPTKWHKYCYDKSIKKRCPEIGENQAQENGKAQ